MAISSVNTQERFLTRLLNAWAVLLFLGSLIFTNWILFACGLALWLAGYWIRPEGFRGFPW